MSISSFHTHIVNLVFVLFLTPVLSNAETCIDLARSGSFDKAADCFSKVNQLSEEQQRVYAGVLTELKQYNKAFQLVKNLSSEHPEQSLYLYQLGKIAALQEDYTQAKKYYQTYIDSNPKNRKAREKALDFIKNYEFLSSSKNDNVVPHKISSAINSSLPEYGPSLDLQNNRIIFTRNVGGQEDLFMATKDEDGKWREAVAIAELNTPDNEGAHALSPDGKFILFTRCGDPDGYGSCDLFVSFRDGDSWSPPQNLGPTINSKAWDAQPNISLDNTQIYFSSSRAGGHGGKDIYVTTWENDKWTTPRNLGPIVNSKGDEESPFLHPDGVTLYYSSNYFPGFGKSDIFRTTLKENQIWTTPLNLGSPYNDEADNVGFYVDWQGSKAYFHKRTRDEGQELSDIYEVQLLEKAKPIPITYLKVKTVDNQSSPISSATVEIVDVTSGEKKKILLTDKQGEILTTLPLGKNYSIYVQKENYVFYNQRIELTSTDKNSPQEYTVILQPMDKTVEKPITLHNVFFNTGESTLTNESFPELDRLVQLLKDNPTAKVKILGHTDNVGSQEDNLTLSQERATSVTQYLVNKGIPADRVSSQGYGETLPVASNDTEEGRRQNRRTEFILIR